MSDSVTVTSSQSWFSRLAESIKSVLFGLALFVLAFPLLFWNEGRAVQTTRSLEEGAGAVVSVPADSVNAANEGKLVHVSGPVSMQPLADPDLGVQAEGVKLIRRVEMYQWKEEERSEKKKKLGGGEETVTTYTYEKAWSSDPIDSSSFQESSGHENPGAFPIEAYTVVADPVNVGAFTLSAEQVDQLDEAQDLRITDAMLETVPDEPLASEMAVSDGRFYLGANPGAPEVGDTRISFQVVKPATASLVGVQSGGTFAPFQAKAGDTILMVEEGTRTAAEMFQAAESANTFMTWMIRGGGFLMMFFGLLAVFKPLSVFADVVPLFGTMLGAGLGVFAFLISAALSIITIAVSWIFVRPLLAIALLALALAGLIWLVSLGRKKKRQRMGMPAPAPA